MQRVYAKSGCVEGGISARERIGAHKGRGQEK